MSIVESGDAIIAPPPPGIAWDPAADRLVGRGSFYLVAGACVTQDVQAWADAPGQDGAWWLGAVADLGNFQSELIETNNALAGTLLGIGAMPDLVVKSVKGPPSVMRGGAFTASLTVCNQGATWGSAPVDLLLSRDAVITYAAYLAQAKASAPDPRSAVADSAYAKIVRRFFRPTLVADPAETARRLTPTAALDAPSHPAPPIWRMRVRRLAGCWNRRPASAIPAGESMMT